MVRTDGSIGDSLTYLAQDKPPALSGDANADGKIDPGDVVYLINYSFRDGPAPDPLWTGDVNCNWIVDNADIVYLIDYLFRSGLPPC